MHTNIPDSPIEKVIALARAGIFLTTAQAALYLNLSPRTLEKYRRVGGGPTYAVYGARCSLFHRVSRLMEERTPSQFNQRSVQILTSIKKELIP